MNDLFVWVTSHRWRHYLLVVYLCGYGVTVCTHTNRFRTALPQAREDYEFMEAENTYPRLVAGILAVAAFVAALSWPLQVVYKWWWRGLVTDNPDRHDE